MSTTPATEGAGDGVVDNLLRALVPQPLPVFLDEREPSERSTIVSAKVRSGRRAANKAARRSRRANR
mgnify:CR=1 FL=1